MSETKSPHSGLTRRSFLKATGAVAGTAVAAGAITPTLVAFGEGPAKGAPEEGSEGKIFSGSCRGSCNYGCAYQGFVREGVLCKVRPNDFPDPLYTGCCLKGLSHPMRTYSANRVKYPMKRAGERGSDKWERISWDQAISEITSKLCELRDTYGGQSIMMDSQTGNHATVNGQGTMLQRLMKCFGGSSVGNIYDRVSAHGMHRAFQCGDHAYANEPRDFLNAKMILVWGTNPVYTDIQTWRFMEKARKENGAKIVVIDPNVSATAVKADLHIPVKPATDAVIALSMGNYIIQNDLFDEEFVKNRTNAPFLVRRDNGMMYKDVEEAATSSEEHYYVHDASSGRVCLFSEAQDVSLEGSFVTEDGVELDTAFTLLKRRLQEYTFEEAEKIAGVPRDVMESFTKMYVENSPVTINLMYGMDHYNNAAEAYHAIAVLQALSGNLGRHGAGFAGAWITSNPANMSGINTPSDPKPITNIPAQHLYDVWKTQTFKGEPYPLKALITACSNSMSNHGDQNRWFTDVFPNMELWVVLEVEMTDTARHADYVLPSAWYWETFDERSNIYNFPYVILDEQAIDPLYECKPDSEIYKLIGNGMGYAQDFPMDRAQEDWVKIALESEKFKEYGVTWEALNEQKIMRCLGGDDEAYIKGGKYEPFDTAHRRVMIYWENPKVRMDYGQEVSEDEFRKARMPFYKLPTEVYEDNPLKEKYPLVFMRPPDRFRTHTQYFNVPILKEIDPEPLARMARETAESRGIKDGDIVEVFNDRGHAVCKAQINDGMAPGILSIPKGWQRNQFYAGGLQELTSSALDPIAVGGAWYDTLVEVRRWEG